MWYDRFGRLRFRGKTAIQPQARPKNPYLKYTDEKVSMVVPSMLAPKPRYDLILGRGKNLGWLCIEYVSNEEYTRALKEKGKYKVKVRSRTSELQLRCYKPTRGNRHIILEHWKVYENKLLVLMPLRKGVIEDSSWYVNMPDVRDNPWDYDPDNLRAV